MKMICPKCNQKMKLGTTYEKRKSKYIARRYIECKKCHYRNYISSHDP